jgi:two-component system chemotaxis sensor kinase CheA
VDKLVNLVGELVITQSMISQMVQDFSVEKLHRLRESVTEMERNTRELQERVMAVRMLPIGNTFSRFPRMVRDLAAALNKKIAVRMVGEETELDKGVIEHIGDPLTHLVRNAVDHGVEAPEERQRAGKPEQAVIRLHAFHQGGNVVIEVADDGGGLNTGRIRQKAIAQGLISADDALGEDQLHALIFQPGFSTVTAVSDLSGRGVGMDVVKKNVEALNGTVSIFSEPGRGTRVRIKLPLTLAIIDGLSLQVGQQTYILPLIAISESLQPRPEQVKHVLGQGEVVVVRGEFLPLLRLHHLFAIPTRVTDPSQGLVVIIENEGKKLGLLVDELLGQSQVVIKNLEANFRKVEGVIGATIMGDGRVALILDVQGLTRIAAQTGGFSACAWTQECGGEITDRGMGAERPGAESSR